MCVVPERERENWQANLELGVRGKPYSETTHPVEREKSLSSPSHPSRHPFRAQAFNGNLIK